MKLIINGESQEQPDGLTVGELLARLGLDATFAAVELNRQLVPRRRHADTILRENDQVEIVTLVGGG
jgi:sulfur carrier protein